MEVLAPPPTDPLVRQEPPFDWYRTPDETRPRVETASSLPDLDPDVALWPVTPVNRWPFTGAPAEGIWPRGWLGVDNTGTAYLCTVGGEPGTWVAAGSGGGGWPTVDGAGSGHLTAQTLVGDTVGYNLTDLGTGGIALTTNNAGSAGIELTDTGGGIGITSDNSVEVSASAAAPLVLEQFGTGGIAIETAGGGATTGIALTTQASDTVGITLANVGGEILLPNIPTTDPSVAHALWSDNGTVVLSGSTSGQVNSVVAGTNVSVDATDPHNPVVSATGGSGTAEQEILQGTVLALAPGNQAGPTWVHASGSTLLDLTDPANVAVVAAGNYGIAVTCLSNEAAMTAGGGFLLQLEYAGAGMLEDAVATANQLFPNAFVGAPPCPLSTEDGFSVKVTNHDPLLTLQFDLQMLITKN